MTLSNGENPYSLIEIILTGYTRSTNSYSDTIVSLDADQVFDVDPQHDTDDQRDSGGISAVLSVKTHSVVKVGYGGLSFNALATMIGATVAESGSGATLVRTLTKRATGTILPYFGAIGVSPSEDGSVLVCGLRAIMLDKEPQVTFDGKTNKFLMNEGQGKAVSIGGMVDHWKAYATQALWDAAKPTDGATFLAWFS